VLALLHFKHFLLSALVLNFPGINEMPPFLSRPVIDIPVTNHVSATPSPDTTFTDTTVAAIRSDNHHDTIEAIDYPSVVSARSTIAPRNSHSGGSTTIGIILGSICGFLVLLAIIYVCYFRHHSTMYIVSTTSSSSSKNSQTKKKKRRRRKPVLFVRLCL